MQRAELIAFLRRHRLAVEATVGANGPQAAVIGVAVTDDADLVFDTLESTRKYANLRRDPRIALVIGWDEVTVQLEGCVDFPVGDELAQIRERYFEAFPDGRERLGWPGIVHARVRPTWIRYSDFTTTPPTIVALPGSRKPARGTGLELVALIVRDYDEAIAFFTRVLGFDLVEDVPSTTNDGRAKRWVVVRPPGNTTALLLARADGADQLAAVGNQTAGRVGFFLRVADFDAHHRRMSAAGVVFRSEPRDEPYGRVAVFEDLCGNRWDLLGDVGR